MHKIGSLHQMVQKAGKPALFYLYGIDLDPVTFVLKYDTDMATYLHAKSFDQWYKSYNLET